MADRTTQTNRKRQKKLSYTMKNNGKKLLTDAK